MGKLSDYYLRPMQDADLEKVLKWRNSKHVRKHMFTNHTISESEHYAWFEKNYLTSSLNIFMKGDQPLGVVNITGIDKKNRRASWGFYLGEENLPRGTGTIMGYLALNLAFGKLKIRKLCSEVLENNKISLNFHKKLGFHEEGLLRKHILISRNTYKDVILLAIFLEEWRKKNTKIKKNFDR